MRLISTQIVLPYRVGVEIWDSIGDCGGLLTVAIKKNIGENHLHAIFILQFSVYLSIWLLHSLFPIIFQLAMHIYITVVF